MMLASHAARPVQAAMASAGTFSVGAAPPLSIVLLAPMSALMWTVAVASLLVSLATRVGGASVRTAAVQVTFWDALA